jgi:tryptophanyl-tRNA synthetase
MSKSSATENGIVYILDDNSTIEKKFKRAVTDSEGVLAYDREAKPGVSNLLDILSACTHTPIDTLVSQYTQYGPLKKDAGDAVISLLEPIRHRYQELHSDPSELSRLLKIGNERARNVAAATLARAHSSIGLLPRI